MNGDDGSKDSTKREDASHRSKITAPKAVVEDSHCDVIASSQAAVTCEVVWDCVSPNTGQSDDGVYYYL